MIRSSWLTCGLLAIALNTASGDGKIVEVSYPPSKQPGELVFGVTYRAWIPPNVAKLRGIIVHQHGCGAGACKGGETAADDLHWQALARKWDCALLGPSFKQEDKDNCRLWCDPRNGSRAKFLQALDDLAKKSEHPELAKVPWCLWGHSGGGFWASLMMASDPDRIVAAWLRSGTAFTAWEGGEIPKPEIPDATYKIPFVSNPGVKERDDNRFRGAWDGGVRMVYAYADKGAPAAFSPDPRTGHECGDSRYLAIPYFDACLAARLPAKGSPTQDLRVITPDVLTRTRYEISAPTPPQGLGISLRYVPCRLPAGLLKSWEEYIKTGAVTDTTPPPAPIAVKVDPDRREVTWDALADFESGIRQFVILKDGQEIGRVPDKPVGTFGRPLFQKMSYHDTPEAPLPAMSFVDSAPKGGKLGEYRVITVNSAGLKSEPSAPATPGR